MPPSLQAIISTLLDSAREFLTVEEVLEVAEADGHPAPSRGEVVDEMKRLQAAGRGRFVSGRRGKPSRFVDESVAPPSTAGRSEPTDRPTEVTATSLVPTSESVEYIFPLRHGFNACLRLPRSLTGPEAERLGKFIHLLVVAPE